MDFSIFVFLLVVGFLLIIISLVERSIIFGVVGSVIVFSMAFIMFNSGIEIQNGVATTQTFNNISISSSLNGTVTTSNTITTKTVKDTNTQWISTGLILLSVFIAYFLYLDYKKRGVA